jgi:hypothetical protein
MWTWDFPRSGLLHETIIINLLKTQWHQTLAILVPCSPYPTASQPMSETHEQMQCLLILESTGFIISSKDEEANGVIYRYCALYQCLWAFISIFQSPTKLLLSDSLFLQHQLDERNSSINCIQGMLFSITLQIPSSRLAYRKYICNT